MNSAAATFAQAIRELDMDVRSLSERRFNALAGYTRDPRTLLTIEELEWHETADERLLGLVTLDRVDHDFGWIILGRDERFRFRAIDVNVSLSSAGEARRELYAKLVEHHSQPDASFHQGDTEGKPTDFFTPLAPPERLSPLFKILTEQTGYSPAKGIIEPMMRFFDDADGNFVQQFQTTAFDARLWELYLFATFIELGYARVSREPIPDFIFKSLYGSIAIEATTINPPNGGRVVDVPSTEEGIASYIENAIPIKLARVLRRKLEKKYWDREELRDVPFALAIQDFHVPGSMRTMTHAATEYVFGVRHSVRDGARHITRISEHVWKGAREPSGFFELPDTRNISAVIVNPQGTLSKFNRLGLVAGFGQSGVRMIRRGFARGENNPVDPRPVQFVHEVHKPDYDERWVEGMVVLHNPNALVPLPPELIVGASHEFLQPDGRIMSLIPDFHPYISETAILQPA